LKLQKEVSLDKLTLVDETTKRSETKRPYQSRSISKPDIQKIPIPLSIFQNKLPPLETLVRYLKDILGLNFSYIAKILNRNETTIWTTYNNSVKKLDSISVDMTASYKVMFSPLSIFSDRRLSVLESLCQYLFKNNLSYQEISTIVNRNQKTVWTVVSRAKKKMAKEANDDPKASIIIKGGADEDQ
jgi:hypothetical protein